MAWKMFSRHKFLHIVKAILHNVLIHLIEEWREYLDKDFVVGAVMADLSKAFDCIPHDLLIAKLEAYGLGEKALSYICSYLTNRNQCVRRNDKKVIFKDNFWCPSRLHNRTNPVYFFDK